MACGKQGNIMEILCYFPKIFDMLEHFSQFCKSTHARWQLGRLGVQLSMLLHFFDNMLPQNG